MGTISGPSESQASFDIDGRILMGKKKSKIVGHVFYHDPAAGVSFQATKITVLTFNGNMAHMAGTGKLNGKGKFSFTIDVTDNSFDGTGDYFSIHLSNGYSASGFLTSGNITNLTGHAGRPRCARALVRHSCLQRGA